jgi:hypothetical protein
MLNSMTILIFDGSGYSSLDLSEAIEESDGRVAGPVATLSETVTILESIDVGGAIVDCQRFQARPKPSCSSPSATFRLSFKRTSRCRSHWETWAKGRVSSRDPWIHGFSSKPC